MTRSLAQSLHEHGAALRRLAGHLVGMAHAHDLVQDAAVEVLQARGSVDQPVAFVRRVLQHLAGKHHRGLRRRRQREATAREPVAPTSPFDAAAQREAVERLHAALMTLPEAVLGALLLRYFEDLSPPQIAARLNVPLPTVKSRLARGLELLRERLTQEDRDWRAGMAVAFGVHGEVAATTTVSVAGVVLMGMTMKVAIAVAAAAVLTWLVWPMAAAPDVVLRQQMVLAEQAGGANEVVGDAVGAAGAERVAAITNAVASNPDWPAPATVRGRCVDEFGVPLVGCRVSWNGMRNDEEEYSKWVRTHYDPQWQNPPAQVTGQDGTFEWVVVPHEPLRFRLGIVCPERVWMGREWPERLRGDGLEPGSRTELGDIVIPSGIAVSGRVVDTDGQPVADARVSLSRLDAAEQGRVTQWRAIGAITRADGSFTLHARVCAGPHRVSAKGLHREYLIDEAHCWLELVVEVDKAPDPADCIRGLVVDDRGGPVGFAQLLVEAGRRPVGWFSSDADGAFTLVRSGVVRRDEPAKISASAGGFDRLVVEDVSWGTTAVRVVLRRGVDVELEVVDQDGRPVEEFAAWIYGIDAYDRGGFCYGRQAAGRSRFVGLSRGRNLLLVEPRDRERLTLSPLTIVDVADPTPMHVRVQLQSPVERLVRVVDAAGEPVAGVTVQLEEGIEGAGQKAESMSPEDYFAPNRAFGGKRLVRHAVSTDDRGEARLRGRGGHHFVVQVPGPHCLPLVVADVRLDVADPLVLQVSRGGSLRVKLGPKGIRDSLIGYSLFGDSIRAATRDAPQLWLREVPGGWQGPARTHCIATITPEGTATFDGVPQGIWHVAVCFLLATHPSSHSQQVEDVGVAQIREGQVVEQSLDLSTLLPSTLDALVLRGREPMRDSMVTLCVVHGPAMNREARMDIKTDAEGRFTWRCRPGSYSIMAPVRSAETVVVPPGGRLPVTFTLPPF